MQFKLALLYWVDGRIAESAHRYTQALQINQALAIQHPDRSEYQANQAVFVGLGGTRVKAGRLDEAERLYVPRTPDLRKP